MGKQRSQPGGASALDYRFFDLQQKADGLFQIALAYQNDVIGQRLYEFAGQFARLLDGNALSQRVAFAWKVLTPHIGVNPRLKLRLQPNQPDLGFTGADRTGDG